MLLFPLSRPAQCPFTGCELAAVLLWAWWWHGFGVRLFAWRGRAWEPAARAR
jgi:hypothetical protein